MENLNFNKITIIIIFIIFIVIPVGRAMLGLGLDSSDKSKWERSDLDIKIDYATGVHYLRGGFFGALTPRLNADGTLYIDKDRK